MGLLPIKDPSSPRTGNIILKPDHPFWSIETPKKLYGGRSPVLSEYNSDAELSRHCTNFLILA